MRVVIRVCNLKKYFYVKERQNIIRDLFFPKFKVVKAVDGISFEVYKGEVIGFIGPNGAGKSTTIKMLVGILFPTEGEVYISGLIPGKDRKRLLGKIGVVFGQRRTLWPELSVKDNLEMIGLFYDLKEDEVEKRIEELSKILDLSEFINRPFRKLSLGQQMRSELAAALIHKPKILFLDEPTIGMDILAKLKFIDLIKELNEKEGITVLLTSQDLQEIQRLCRRIIIINKGKILYDGPLEKIKPNRVLVRIKTADEKIIEKEIPRNKVKEVISNLSGEVLDIEISEIPIEEIIKEFYR